MLCNLQNLTSFYSLHAVVPRCACEPPHLDHELNLNKCGQHRYKTHDQRNVPQMESNVETKSRQHLFFPNFFEVCLEPTHLRLCSFSFLGVDNTTLSVTCVLNSGQGKWQRMHCYNARRRSGLSVTCCSQMLQGTGKTMMCINITKVMGQRREDGSLHTCPVQHNPF